MLDKSSERAINPLDRAIIIEKQAKPEILDFTYDVFSNKIIFVFYFIKAL